jgi:hypothetical protein
MRITEDRLIELGFSKRDNKHDDRTLWFIPRDPNLSTEFDVGFVFRFDDYPPDNPNCGILSVYHGEIKNIPILGEPIPCPKCKNKDDFEILNANRKKDPFVKCNVCGHEINHDEFHDEVPKETWPAKSMMIATHIWDDDRLIEIYECITGNKLPLEDLNLYRFSD